MKIGVGDCCLAPIQQFFSYIILVGLLAEDKKKE
jgi:hypothetical protein